MSADNQARGGASEAEVDPLEAKRSKTEALLKPYEPLARELFGWRYPEHSWSSASQLARWNWCLLARDRFMPAAAQVRAGQDEMEDLTLQICFDKVVKDRDAASARAAKAVEASGTLRKSLTIISAVVGDIFKKGEISEIEMRGALEHARKTLRDLSDHRAPEPGVEAGEVRNAALEAIDD